MTKTRNVLQLYAGEIKRGSIYLAIEEDDPRFLNCLE